MADDKKSDETRSLIDRINDARGAAVEVDATAETAVVSEPLDGEAPAGNDPAEGTAGAADDTQDGAGDYPLPAETAEWPSLDDLEPEPEPAAAKPSGFKARAAALPRRARLIAGGCAVALAVACGLGVYCASARGGSAQAGGEAASEQTAEALSLKERAEAELGSLSFAGQDVSASSDEKTEVRASADRVMVVETAPDVSDAAKVLERAAKRSAALASGLSQAGEAVVKDAGSASAGGDATSGSTADGGSAASSGSEADGDTTKNDAESSGGGSAGGATDSSASGSASGGASGSAASTAGGVADVTYVVTDATGNVQVAVENKPTSSAAQEAGKGSSQATVPEVVKGSDGWAVSGDVVSKLPEDQKVEQSGGEAPTTPAGGKIEAGKPVPSDGEKKDETANGEAPTDDGQKADEQKSDTSTDSSGAATEGKKQDGQQASSAGDKSSSAGSGSGSSSSGSGESSASSSTSSGGFASAQKRWVVDQAAWDEPVYEEQPVYGTQWVQDSAAWDEPVYEITEYLRCSCGATFSNSDQWGDHDYFVHNGNSSCSIQQKSVQTGTTHHDATGHYETVQTGTRTVQTGTVHHDEVGHWE